MAKLRGSDVYKTLKRPYTRKSKFKQHMYIRGGIPSKRTVKFDMGDMNSNYPLRVSLFTLQEGTLLDNAIEASRQTANKFLLKSFGGKQSGFHFKIKVFPHHIVRIHPIAMGAGADRYSTGMARAYGKPTNLGARVSAGQELMYIEVPIEKEAVAKEALRKATCKLPFKSLIEVTKKERKKADK
ncbi:MAG: 50S ribosomal protein L16 [Candidatus Nanoarchaeia archaeon]|nr:50S ribosomal protein L16 [Candidatus Nanoarchaeia archaeon]MDD5054166.1 50S ribosomal protein L16 [Candidatus Nanoarchaeia archaeon]MDD5499681.1 50S ribosomal protein L16 [Candidatus Nanoarchaeia archaeon]